MATPTTVRSSTLQGNLQALGARNAEVARRISTTPPATALELVPSADDVVAGIYQRRALCSRHHPLAEADRLVSTVDVLDHAVIVVMGFGMGYHVRRLAERLDRTGVIVVLEPDLALLRAVFEQVDHSSWLADALVVIADDPDDLSALARALDGSESIVAQGVTILEHPASRSRLGDSAGRFATRFSEYVSNARTTILTTLVRSVDTVRNLVLNIDHYVGGPGITDLADTMTGFPAIVVSAGPSLHRNIERLSDPAVRDRCVIVAVQTTLKPLLAAGIRPHFVTALDYHEISQRFYEDLDPEQLRDVTLIADPKVHPAVIDIFPGRVRCCASGFLDKLLGDAVEAKGSLPAGATVAHLSLYTARYLGCDPVIFVGQDLAFTDGLYYAPGTAIHDVWAPELNPFNTIEMMEWQRIARHRVHLHKRTDAAGRTVFTDAQMLAYLQQFERDFAADVERGRTVIDATEGGIRMQHTLPMTLHDALSQYAGRELPTLPPLSVPPHDALRSARERLLDVRRDIRQLRTVSRRTVGHIESMLTAQEDADRMHKLFEDIQREREAVEERFDAFELLNHFNQMGVFRRIRADRRLHLQPALTPKERQRAQLERDLDNVTWLEDAAADLMQLLELGARLLDGERVTRANLSRGVDLSIDSSPDSSRRVGAIIPVTTADIRGPGLGGRSALHTTVRRLSRVSHFESIVLVCDPDVPADCLPTSAPGALPVIVHRASTPLFGPTRRAIRVGRVVAGSSWRGAIAGLSIFDEVCCPTPMLDAMCEHDLDAVVLVGPDWPLVDTSAESGCEALVTRYREHPNQHRFVFTQAPPGLSSCLISRELMTDLTAGHRLATLGARLVYQPQVPQGDPIARDANVQIEHTIRRRLERFTFDRPHRHDAITKLADDTWLDQSRLTGEQLDSLEDALRASSLPTHVHLELCTDRRHRGLVTRHGFHEVSRPPAADALIDRVIEQIASVPEVTLTLDGAGDPLLHPACMKTITAARNAGIAAVHVRTELNVSRDTLDALIDSGVDIISIDLHADRATTYQTMLGHDGFTTILGNLHHLIERRRRLSDHSGAVALALPWLVPVIERRRETIDDIDSFYDRWTYLLGTALIEAPLLGGVNTPPPGSVAPTWPPAQLRERDDRRHLRILSDGTMPLDRLDLVGVNCIGTILDTPLMELWPALLDARSARKNRS